MSSSVAVRTRYVTALRSPSKRRSQVSERTCKDAGQPMTSETLTPLWRLSLFVAALSSTAAMPAISQQARAALDRSLGAKGVYVDEESAYKFTFLRSDIRVQVGRQQLSPAQTPRSWATFSPSIHQEGMLNGEIIVLEDEV